jgi:tetratricopeptide (TPR) repeat protein
LAAIDEVRDMIRIQNGRCAIENCLAFQEERAQLTTSLGLVYEAIEDIKEAEECFNVSVSIYREVLARKTELGLDVVQTFIELHKTASVAGNLFYESCDYAKALSFYEMALDSPLPPIISHREKNAQGQMDANSQQQRPDSDGRRAVEQVNIICNDEKDEEYSQKKMLLCRADMLHNIANVFSVLNDTENSIILYLQAFKLQTEVLGQNDPQVATTLHNVATSYYRAGRYDEAIRRYRQVLKYSSQQENSHHPLTFDALVGIGMTLAKTGEWDQALSVYDAALQIPMRDNRQQAKKAAVYNAIGEIHTETGVASAA